MKNKTKICYLFFLFFVIKISIAQNSIEKLNAEVATQWFDLQLKMIPTTPSFTPPVVARSLGYTALTLYEALVHGMPNYKSLVGELKELEKLSLPNKNLTYNWQIVANSALAVIHEDFFAKNAKENLIKITSLRDHLNTKLRGPVSEAAFKASVIYGEELAHAIFKYSKTDGGHQAEIHNFPKDFKHPPGACMWTPIGKQNALLPYWGSNRTFIKGNADFEVKIPPKCEVGNSSILYAQALEVYSVGKNLSEEQKEIAKFWSDDTGITFTPPGHGFSIALQLIKKEKMPLDKAAETLCRIGIAVNDAFISCWKCKYQHNMLRPVSFIQTTIDPGWNAYLENPPFPEYTSGHGTVSGAIAAVLNDIFGYNYPFTDHSHGGTGLKPRSYESFNEFAEEAALSRLYGGIHYRMSTEEGLKNGKRIGRSACNLELKVKKF